MAWKAIDGDIDEHVHLGLGQPSEEIPDDDREEGGTDDVHYLVHRRRVHAPGE
jgi:hypothetical protein